MIPKAFHVKEKVSDKLTAIIANIGLKENSRARLLSYNWTIKKMIIKMVELFLIQKSIIV